MIALFPGTLRYEFLSAWAGSFIRATSVEERWRRDGRWWRCIWDSSEHVLCNNTGRKPTQKDYNACIFSTWKMFPSTVLELQSLEFHERFVNSLADLKGRRVTLSGLTLVLGLHSSFICRKFTFYNSDRVCVFSIKLLPDSQSLVNCALSGQGWGQMRG